MRSWRECTGRGGEMQRLYFSPLPEGAGRGSHALRRNAEQADAVPLLVAVVVLDEDAFSFDLVQFPRKVVRPAAPTAFDLDAMPHLEAPDQLRSKHDFGAL